MVKFITAPGPPALQRRSLFRVIAHAIEFWQSPAVIDAGDDPQLTATLETSPDIDRKQGQVPLWIAVSMGRRNTRGKPRRLGFGLQSLAELSVKLSQHKFPVVK